MFCKSGKKLEGVIVSRLRARSTGKLVGWNYQWNTGDIDPLWLDGPVKDFDVEPIQSFTISREGENL